MYRPKAKGESAGNPGRAHIEATHKALQLVFCAACGRTETPSRSRVALYCNKERKALVLREGAAYIVAVTPVPSHVKDYCKFYCAENAHQRAQKFVMTGELPYNPAVWFEQPNC